MSIRDRIIEFCKTEGISGNEFERICGLKHNYVHGIKKSIGEDKLLKISEAFPDLNEDWLLKGKGTMHKSDKPEAVITAEEMQKLIESQQGILERQAGTIQSQAETIQNQQRLLEKLIDTKFQSHAPTENPAGCADAAGA